MVFLLFGILLIGQEEETKEKPCGLTERKNEILQLN
jgi:hypothetical protein